MIYEIPLPKLYPTTYRRWHDGHNIIRHKHVAAQGLWPVHLFFVQINGNLKLKAQIEFRVFFRTRRMYDHVLGGNGIDPITIPAGSFDFGMPPIHLHSDGFSKGDPIEFRFAYLGVPEENEPVEMRAVFSDGIPETFGDTMATFRKSIGGSDAAWAEKQRAGNAARRADPTGPYGADFEPPYEQ